MVALSILGLLGAISFFVPRKKMKAYFCVAALILGGLLMCYTPPETDDLARYYNLFETIKQLRFGEILNGQYGTDDWLINYMLNDYKANAPVFMAVLFLISRIGVKELVVFIFAILTYIPAFFLILEVCEDEKCKKGILCICFCMVLACFDFRFVSCLRNLSAYAMFVYVLYRDLTKKTKTRICFIFYISLCMLHMSCVTLLGMRILLFIKNKLINRIIIVILFGIQVFIPVITFISNKVFYEIPYIVRLVQKINDYFLGRTDYNIKGSLFFICTILVVIMIWSIAKIEKFIPPKYYKYSSMFVLVVAFTIGCISQYDVLLRNTQLVVLLVIPFVALFLKRVVLTGYKSIRLISANRKYEILNLMVGVSIIGIIVLSMFFYTKFSYLPIDSYFFRYEKY